MTMNGLRLVLAPEQLDPLMVEGAALTDEAATRMALGIDRRGAERA